MRTRLETLFQALTTRILGKEVTVYPTYGYRDPGEPRMWVVPMRVWVHDNRDTPLVEGAFERWASGYFEKDLKRPLEPDKKVHLRACPDNFIADDKSNEVVEFIFPEASDTVFQFTQRTTFNGVIEESIRVPDALVHVCSRQAGRGHWV